MRLSFKYNSYGNFSGILKSLLSLGLTLLRMGSGDKKARSILRLKLSFQGTAGMCVGPSVNVVFHRGTVF